MTAPAINQSYLANALKQDCVYSSQDSEGRGGKACNSSDDAQASECVREVNENDFRSEAFGWNWGTGCADISTASGTGGAIATAAAGAASSALGIPGVSQIVSLIAGIFNRGSVIHNKENELLCSIVPYVAYLLASIVASFRAGNMTASQASQYMAQVLGQTQRALGSEAGRGSGQGLLRNIAVVNAYFDYELPDEEAARASSSVAAPGAVNVLSQASNLSSQAPAPAQLQTSTVQQPSLFVWVLLGGAILVALILA